MVIHDNTQLQIKVLCCSGQNYLDFNTI